jgi:Protein of unknown function (DUF4239)
MNFFWLYDISTLSLFALVVGVLVAISLAGALVMRKRFDTWLGLSEETNDIVGHFLAFTGAFYGIMLGLVAVGAWDTFNGASAATEREASALVALYRDVTMLPGPHDGRSQVLLRAYAWRVINREWPDQRVGQNPTSAERAIDALGAEIATIKISNPTQQINVAEAIKQYNNVLEARRARIQSTQGGLPSSLWYVIIAGGLINIVMTWLLVIKNEHLDLLVNLLMSGLLGSVLAFVIAMDNPYRGELSVSADPIVMVYEKVMDGGPEEPLFR